MIGSFLSISFFETLLWPEETIRSDIVSFFLFYLGSPVSCSLILSCLDFLMLISMEWEELRIVTSSLAQQPFTLHYPILYIYFHYITLFIWLNMAPLNPKIVAIVIMIIVAIIVGSDNLVPSFNYNLTNNIPGKAAAIIIPNNPPNKPNIDLIIVFRLNTSLKDIS